MKLKYKIMLFYGIMLIIPMTIIAIVNVKVLTSSLLENMEYSAGQGYEQSLSFLNYKLNRTVKLSDTIISNKEINDIISKKMDNYTIFEQISDMNKLRVYLQTVDEQNVHKVRFYVNDDYLFADDNSVIFGLKVAEGSLWYNKKDNSVIYFSPGLYLEENNQQNYVSLVRNMIDLNQYSRRIGVLRIDMTKSVLEEILQKANPTNRAVTYLVNSENILVASSDYRLIEEYGFADIIPEELGWNAKDYQNSLEKSEIQGEQIYYIKKNVDNTNWAMVTLIPAGDFMESIDQISGLIISLVIAFAIFTYVIGSFFITKIMKRISNLVDSIQEFKNGNTKVHLKNISKDEIGILYDNYNEMIQKTNQLLEEKYEMGKELKTAEIRALHSQINPHFLYNTLEMINWLGYEKRAEDIHKVVISLSKFYRLTLNKGKELLSVDEELKHVGYYLKIESIRFSGKIQYEIMVDEDVLNCSISNVTLQPLVENAILHGILEKDEKHGQIRIWGGREENKVLLHIQDDGKGFDDGRLKQILNTPISSSEGFYGIRNVNRRIQLLFGQEYGLTYQSRVGIGTTVTICLPYEMP